MRPLYELTPKQYRERIIRLRMAEYGVSRAEAEFDLSPAEIERRHLTVVMLAADQGIKIRRQVLDAMGRARNNILKWHAEQYVDYMPPDVRKLNRESAGYVN